MPLRKGAKAKTKAGVSANIRAERKAGKSQAQSVAIAMRLAGKRTIAMRPAGKRKKRKGK